MNKARWKDINNLLNATTSGSISGSLQEPLVQEPDGHFLFYVCPLQHLQDKIKHDRNQSRLGRYLDKLLKGDEVVLVLVCLQDGPLGDGEELLGADVGPDHHGQHGQQLLLHEDGVDRMSGRRVKCVDRMLGRRGKCVDRMSGRRGKCGG